MLDRIRRALSRARGLRHSSRGRHRRPLTPDRPPVAAVPHPGRPTAAPAFHLEHSDHSDHTALLRGEEVALVRPYVVAWERRTRRRSVIMAPYLPTGPEAWVPLAGAR